MRWLMMVAVLAPSVVLADPQTDRLFKGKCGACHGADGKGQTEQGKKMMLSDMTTPAWQSSATDAKIKATISDGIKTQKNGVSQEMEGYKTKLRADQIDALVAYVRALKK